MAREVIPVAYVTKWAKTVGIAVWRDAEKTVSGYLYKKGKWMVSTNAKHWTTDKAVAEARWRHAVETEAKRLKLAAKKYEALSKGAPVYAKEEG